MKKNIDIFHKHLQQTVTTNALQQTVTTNAYNMSTTTFVVSEILNKKRFVGYKFIPNEKLQSLPPPPPILIGDADILSKPKTCCGNLVNGRNCEKKGKYLTDIKSDKWYCGFHLTADNRTFEFKKKYVSKIEQCSICFDNIDLKDDCTKTMCGHMFHTECLKEWNKLNQNCPNCRTGLFSKDIRANNILIYNMFLLKKALNIKQIFSVNIESYYNFKLKQSIRMQKELDFLLNCRRDIVASMLLIVISTINENKELFDTLNK